MRKAQRSRRRKEPPLVGSVLRDKERLMIQLRASAAAKGVRGSQRMERTRRSRHRGQKASHVIGRQHRRPSRRGRA